MKKYILMTVASIIISLLIGCGESDNQKNTCSTNCAAQTTNKKCMAGVCGCESKADCAQDEVCGTDNTCKKAEDPNTIGPEGGTLKSADGKLSLEIPAGALTQAITFTVDYQETNRIAPSGTKAYDIGPSGTTFAKPAKLSVQYEPSILAMRVPKMIISDPDNPGKWIALANLQVDLDLGTVSADMNHLSEIRDAGNVAVDSCGGLLCAQASDCAPKCACFACEHIQDEDGLMYGECLSVEQACP